MTRRSLLCIGGALDGQYREIDDIDHTLMVPIPPPPVYPDKDAGIPKLTYEYYRKCGMLADPNAIVLVESSIAAPATVMLKLIAGYKPREPSELSLEDAEKEVRKIGYTIRRNEEGYYQIKPIDDKAPWPRAAWYSPQAALDEAFAQAERRRPKDDTV